MRFDGLDLNLLVALDTLLDKQSVSVAADRLNLSQPAMSGALARLRTYFGDELLRSVGSRMVRTPRGDELAVPVREVLLRIRATISKPPAFDPASCHRRIGILCSDYVVRVALAPALRLVAAEAPGVTVEIGALADHPDEHIEKAETDLLIAADKYLSPDHPVELLFDDDYVVVAWRGNEAFSGNIDLETFLQLGHISVSHGITRHPTFEAWFAANMGMTRNVEVVAPGFSDVAHLLIGTPRIATMHRRLAEMLATYLPLRTCPVPFEIPAVHIAAQRHQIRGGDKLLDWVVSKIREAAATPLDVLHPPAGEPAAAAVSRLRSVK